MAGFRLIGALAAFWLVLESGWLYINRQVTIRQIMTIDSFEREYFFTFVKSLLLASCLVIPLGLWLGNRLGQWVCQQPNLSWLRPVSLALGWVWVAITLYALASGLLIPASPGLKLDRQGDSSKLDSKTARWLLAETT